jgi:hypothetical protein
MIGQFRLPFEQTPAKTLDVRTSESDSDEEESERKEEYCRIIDRKTREVSQSIVEQWPSRYYELPNKWFDARLCRKKVDGYLQSISRNIDFRAHIHRLQPILNSYENTIPPKKPYVFSPTFISKSPKASSPSLREILKSRAHLSESPTPERLPPDFAISSTVTMATEINPPAAMGDSLSSLIQELRHSRESFLQLYGEDLNKSYDDLMGKGASHLWQRSIPPHEELLKYRDLCSKTKDALFSGISEALAPSQKLETVISASGLWPRITPRSILQELSSNRVRTLTNQWKHAITCYAVAFLKYQQSQRLLELSSQRRNEEFFREAETICEDVASDCSPDWLLIQVS